MGQYIYYVSDNFYNALDNSIYVFQYLPEQYFSNKNFGEESENPLKE